MAEKKVTLRALRSFEGTEGMIRRDDIFTVEGTKRADELKGMQLAEDAPSGAEVTNYAQRRAELNDMSKEDLEKTAAAEGVTYPDGALKEDIRTAIVRSREDSYLKEQAAKTAVYNTGAPAGTDTTAAADSGTATGSGTTGSTGAGTGE